MCLCMSMCLERECWTLLQQRAIALLLSQLLGIIHSSIIDLMRQSKYKNETRIKQEGNKKDQVAIKEGPSKYGGTKVQKWKEELIFHEEKFNTTGNLAQLVRGVMLSLSSSRYEVRAPLVNEGTAEVNESTAEKIKVPLLFVKVPLVLSDILERTACLIINWYYKNFGFWNGFGSRMHRFKGKLTD
ncbi:hypothetical protein Tco_0413202 [Tanacetum coccineum]